VAACPPSAAYRLRKFARKHRRLLATAAVVVLAPLSAVGSIGWAVRDRQARRAALEQEAGRALEEVRALCRDDRTPEALATVQRAEALLAGSPGSEELLRRAGQMRADLEMATRLDEARRAGGPSR
jgi:hypothetical protein